MIPVLETQRLRLREFKATDKEAFAALNASPEFSRYFGNGEPIGRLDSWKVMAMIAGHWQLYGFGFWLVEEIETKKLVGRIGIWHPDGWPGTEIGWGISPEFWGKGYAKEAALAAMKWGFENLAVDELISVIHPENKASKNLALAVGESYSHNEDVFGKPSEIYKITRVDFMGN
ncbi:GNAT family N-acetyltransferase [Reinekea sp.]|jgi:RimJ/RimL family protein N-acetyltransferase|uniref:GNAT family N-acetyltransferase n=1 Tax=Reinekea sp. TaxID=1970455 RepID=UPI003989846E